jgi:hypothetical protein
MLLSILMVVNTLVYYIFQHLYLVFIVTFTTMSTFHIWAVYHLMFKLKKGGMVTQRLCIVSQISYVGIGLPLWLVDMFYCDWYLQNLAGSLFGMTFHVLWHFGAGFGAYLGIVSLENCRVEALGLPSRLEYCFGCIPYIQLIDELKKD